MLFLSVVPNVYYHNLHFHTFENYHHAIFIGPISKGSKSISTSEVRTITVFIFLKHTLINFTMEWPSLTFSFMKNLPVVSVILSRVLVTETGFGLVTVFINRLQLVITNNYNTVPDLHNLQSLHYNLLRLFPLVFTIRFLATDLNTGIVADSHFKHRCTKSVLITINTAMPLFLHFMVHCYTHTSPRLVTQLKHRN
jgi:hypothetical protein